jgi:archaellum component FlaC
MNKKEYNSVVDHAIDAMNERNDWITDFKNKATKSQEGIKLTFNSMGDIYTVYSISKIREEVQELKSAISTLRSEIRELKEKHTR